MQKLFTSFQECTVFLHQNRPPCILVGSDHVDDVHLFTELWLTEKSQLFDSSLLTVKELSEKTESYNLFATHENIVLTQVDKLMESVRDFLIGYTQHPHPNVTLLLLTTKQLAFHSLTKELASGISLSLFKESLSERDSRIAQLLIRRASNQGLFCSPRIAQAFIKKFPQADLHYLLSEFHKLLCQIGKEKQSVEQSHIDQLERKELFSLWKLRDALFRRERKRSIECFRALIEENNEDPLAIVAFLRSQCLFGLRHLEQALFQAYGKESLLQTLSALFYAESLIKANTQDPNLAIETLIVRLTSGYKTKR